MTVTILSSIVTALESAYLSVQQFKEDPEGVVHVLGAEPADLSAEGPGCHPRPVDMSQFGARSSARPAHRNVLTAAPGSVAAGPFGITQGVTISFHIVTVP
jgi:hypothetical protein